MAVRVATQALTRNIRRSGVGVVKLNHAHLRVRQLETLTLPDLPYDYHELEPGISAEIMELHHQKHHQTYFTNFNRAQEQLHHAMSKADSTTVVELQSAIKFNGGGERTRVMPETGSNPKWKTTDYMNNQRLF
ncbi:superoxide dismutase [Mn] 1, mitochondrial-like [Herrania umbratica]|uniref:superoxide dismutase n=1 Tax=Herrania umbratica TaxID=108875 RepID=A0A6J0ZTB3_9ROSI|nr:superoxide dismutase [Mn] 1, mitochondrial-like [Herrania umbratica]